MTGPNNQLVPSLILHAILLSVSVIWASVAMPYLMSEWKISEESGEEKLLR